MCRSGTLSRMGRSPTPPPSDFSLRVIALIRHELGNRGADVSGRWLAARTSMSANYIHIRLKGDRPFNTNDIDEIAKAFGYSPVAFVQQAEKLRHTAAAG